MPRKELKQTDVQNTYGVRERYMNRNKYNNKGKDAKDINCLN